jgi:phage RecT family recombinase
MAETTAITITDEQVRGDVVRFSNSYIKPIYRGRDYEGWMMDAVLCVLQNDELKKTIQSTEGKALFVRSLQLSAASGLSLNPQKGESCIVAYSGNKGARVNFMPMKNGIVKMAMRTGKVSKIESGTIFEKDLFIPKKTSEGDKYEWTPAIKDRGPARAYFAFAKLSDGTGVLEYWEKTQVEEWARKYGNGKVWDDAKRKYLDQFKADSAWGKSFDGQAEKTVIKALLRGLYLPELDEYLDVTEEREAEAEQVDQVGGASLVSEINKAEQETKEAERKAETLAKEAAEGPEAKIGDKELF